MKNIVHSICYIISHYVEDTYYFSLKDWFIRELSLHEVKLKYYDSLVRFNNEIISETRKFILYRTNSFYYATMVELTCAFALVTSVFRDYRKHRLAFRAWLPFNYSSPMLFRIAYVHQAISLTAGSVLHVACDSIICGLLMHVCSQLEILECHLKKVVNKPHLLRECVIQHTCIFQLIFELLLLQIKIFRNIQFNVWKLKFNWF
jgi:hypothetical protein